MENIDINDNQQENQLKGFIHGIETCGAVDGPGIRFVVYTQGCPLECVYCHNSDATKFGGGTAMTVSEIIKELVRYRPYVKASRGGITVSGGEPLMQADFVAELLKRAKDEGFHTALDTSGYADLEKAKKVLQYADLVLLDLKSYLPAIHKKVTGVKPDIIHHFAHYLASINKPVWIRFVYVPGWTDNKENLIALREYVSALRNVERFEVLPFHKMGEHKWLNGRGPYRLSDVEPPKISEIHEVVNFFSQAGINAC